MEKEKRKIEDSNYKGNPWGFAIEWLLVLVVLALIVFAILWLLGPIIGSFYPPVISGSAL